jgi:hypothetical protein
MRSDQLDQLPNVSSPVLTRPVSNSLNQSSSLLCKARVATRTAQVTASAAEFTVVSEIGSTSQFAYL